MRKGARGAEHGAGSREHGAGSTKQGAGSTERGARSTEHEAGSRERGARGAEHGAGARGFRVRESGFTLVELLVVICIIAILTALVTVAITAAMSSARQSNTQVMIDTMSGALAQYAQRWGDYPPSTVSDLGGRAPNDTNNGIEAFVASMSSQKRGGILYRPPSEEHYSNTDTDKVSANLTEWYFGSNDLREITDLYGFVIAYVHHKDFARPRPEVLKYVFTDKSEAKPIRIEQSAATRTFVNAGKFQIMSPGKDGVPGTPDDIRASQ